MKRVLVLGAAGMLGHKILQRLSSKLDVIGAVRRRDSLVTELERLTSSSVVPGLDVEDLASAERIVDRVNPDVVVNCTGIIKQREDAKNAIRSIRVNSLFPHELSAMCGTRGIRLVHLSTDCVFSGRRGMYNEEDLPDPVDIYGRSKLLGEVDAPHALTIRTSMIGRELRNLHSLVEWFLAQPADRAVRGFTAAVFSGLTTIALADEIGRVILDHPGIAGVYNVSADPISKYDLLTLLAKAHSLKTTIIPDSTFKCDRSLDSKAYRSLTGFQPRPWSELITELAADPTPYRRLQALGQESPTGPGADGPPADEPIGRLTPPISGATLPVA